MKVILFGASGMVGTSVLGECLRDPGVERVLSIGRTQAGVVDPKLTEMLRPDMFDANVPDGDIAGYDACFFCLGVSSVGKDEAEYTRLTYDLTMAWAKPLARVNPDLAFFYVSGMGTDGTAMWARVKARTENELLALLPKAVMIRLGALRPMNGERSKAPYAGVLLTIFGPLWPLFQKLWPNSVITSEELGRAFLRVVREGSSKRVLESADLVALGRR